MLARLQVLNDQKNERFRLAKESGDLVECGCCFDDECMLENVATCEDGHIFCKECIKRSTEVAIGDGQFKFPCFSEGCTYQFPMNVIQSLLSPNMFSILIRKMQEEEVKQADLEGLESCPFCSFATIMTNPDDKVFKCLNPECSTDSCRYIYIT